MEVKHRRFPREQGLLQPISPVLSSEFFGASWDLIDNEDRSGRLGIAFDIFSPQRHGDVEISAPLGIHEEAGIEGQVGDYREQKIFSGKKEE